MIKEIAGSTMSMAIARFMMVFGMPILLGLIIYANTKLDNMQVQIFNIGIRVAVNEKNISGIDNRQTQYENRIDNRQIKIEDRMEPLERDVIRLKCVTMRLGC